MKKKLFLFAISLVLFMGFQAYSTISASRQEPSNPGKAIMATGDVEPAVTLMVNKDGKVFFKDEKGDNLGLCRMPGTKPSNSDLPICKVSGQKMTVIGMKAIPILESEGSGCITFGPDAFGHYWEYCW